MKESVENTIKISMLSIMVILGLIVVFPQSLDLMDFIIEDNRAKIERYKQNVNSWKKSLPSFDNISPKRVDVKEYISSLKHVKKVYCIGDIPKTLYSKKESKKGKLLGSLKIKFQAVIQKGSRLQLKTGYLTVSPKLRTESYGHWIFPSHREVFEKWQYRENPYQFTREIEFKDTSSLLSKSLDIVRVKQCE